MLVVKEDQILVFTSIADKDFEDRMIESLIENFPEHPTMENQLREFVVQAIGEAKRFEFVLETDVEVYLYLKYKFAIVKNYRNFLQNETLDILTYPDRLSSLKLTLLINFLEQL